MLRLQSLWPGCSLVPWEGEVLPTTHLPKDQLRGHEAPPPSPASWGWVTHLLHMHITGFQAAHSQPPWGCIWRNHKALVFIQSQLS